jgi:hypothetical protein
MKANSFQSHRLFAALSLYLWFLSTPASAQNLKCFILTPPEQLLPGVKRVAVMDLATTSRYNFSDDRTKDKGKKSDLEKVLGVVTTLAKKEEERFKDSGAKLADYMIAALLENDRGVKEVGSGFLGLGKKEGRSFQAGAHTDIFAVVERTRVEQIIEELKLGQSGLIDDRQAAQAGRLLGVDAVISGAVSASCDDQLLTENREDKKKGKYQVNCHDRDTSINAAIRIVQVETGQVIGSIEKRKSSDEKKCEGEWGDLSTPEASVDKLLREAAYELVNYFAPRFQYQKLDFADLENNAHKRYKETAKKALEGYDLDTAFMQYTAVAEQDPYESAAHFNLGVLHEAVGNYRLAVEKYGLAFKLKSKEKKYMEAQNRVRKQDEFWKQLNAMDIFLQERAFTVAAEQIQVLTTARIEVKGPGSARRAIKAEPSAASATLINVPGEIELEYLGVSGQWYKVKLLDGREGYILKDDAKLIN